MASLSIDIATTFMGLAKRQTPQFYGLRTAVFPTLWKTSKCQRFSLSTSSSSRISVAINTSSKPNRFSRGFTVSATSTSAPQSEDSDILTKIPQDNRIPATIITGFLGSGKVCFFSFTTSWYSWFFLVLLVFTPYCLNFFWSVNSSFYLMILISVID